MRFAIARRGAPRGLLIGLLLYALSAGQASGSFDEPVELLYRFTWAGVPIAELGLRHATDSTVYQTEIAIRTIGLADQLVGFRGSSHATGRYEEPDGFQCLALPQRFQFRTGRAVAFWSVSIGRPAMSSSSS